METRELLEQINKFHEDVELTPQQVRNIFNAITLDDVELEEDEKVTTDKIKTMYNEYPIYGLSYESGYIIKTDDYDSYLQDVANEFAQALPDGIDDFFPSDELYKYIKNQNKDVANSYLESCIQFINKNRDESYYVYTRQDSGEYEGVDYILIDEDYING